MANSQFLRMKKLKGENIIELAARHNHREIAMELGSGYNSIDITRTKLNYVIQGGLTSLAISLAAEERMNIAGVVKRKNGVMALELIFSLNPSTAINEKEYFTRATTWCESYFGAPVISAIVHLDEGAPHCHVLVLPLVGNRMIGSDLMGNKSKLQATQHDFNDKVGRHFGLLYKEKAKRLTGCTRQAMAMSILRELGSKAYLLGAPVIRNILLELISADPERLHAEMALIPPATKTVSRQKSFVEIMTSHTKDRVKRECEVHG
jgi:hypothetical protein